MGFNPLDPSDWEDLGNTIGDTFNSAVDIIAGAGDTMIGTLADGAIKVFKSSAGVVSYAADLTKTSASDIKSWTESAAGDVGEFTVGAYQQAGGWAMAAWQTLRDLLMMSPPELGPVDPRARQAMVALLGLGIDDAVIKAWEEDAKRKGYTLAFDLRGKFAVPGVMAGAFGGVYVDKLGQWGFIGAVGVSTNASPSLNMQAIIDVYMIFGGRDAYSRKYLMPGIVLAIPLQTGGAIAAGGNVLLTETYDFKGFKLMCGMDAIKPNFPMVLPDFGPPQNNILAATLSVKSSAYDAACRVRQTPDQEAAILSTATAASLPFLRDPSRSYYVITDLSKRKCIEIVGASLENKAKVALDVKAEAPHHQFRFLPADQNGTSFYLQPVHAISGNKVLDITGKSKSKGAYVQQYHLVGSDNDNQKFRFTTTNNGSFCIIAKHSGLALDLEGNSSDVGTRLQQYPWHGKTNQRFRAVAV
jgi:hypothetical protein